MESIPLLGFTIAPEKEEGSSEVGPVFHLYHKKTLFYSFKAEDSSSAQRYQQQIAFYFLVCLAEKCRLALHCSMQAPGGPSTAAGLHVLSHET